MSVNFTCGRLVASAIATVRHGATFEHCGLSLPVGSTYATLLSFPHDPSGRHALDAQSVCLEHPTHMWSELHTGVGPAHALASASVHWTQLIEPVSQTGVGAAHCSLELHVFGASPSRQSS
jgi:hypothetical protein